ncbi:hypothetical protein HYPSUDRAFT_173623 [Hypholoma sublateritium FD-334 SS-4]|uniref:F-box domain-containing protein n=1 Tax=Hypholoma sublateritium (strain FD-334 SS-4) TaxID=945553 RepID=A0A0D2KHY0_HYPSF|nr:hypothetical protein HYPSUDRAFT_173623 [Hypholoma sublateritium FD-334 SS-4]
MSIFSLSEDIFSTNRAPTDEERAQIADLLADYDNRIAILTKKIADLDAERAVLQNAAAPLKRTMSSFRRLPDDVIRGIFIACLDPTRNPTMSCREAPVLLTRISSSTRSVALHTPALWAAIHIPIIRHSKGSKSKRKPARVSIMSARTRGVEEWLLRRSGVMPRSISVRELPHPYLSRLLWTNPLADEILSILLQCRARWRDVSFAIVSSSQFRLAFVKPEQVPLIRSITLRAQSSQPSFETGCWLISCC